MRTAAAKRLRVAVSAPALHDGMAAAAGGRVPARGGGAPRGLAGPSSAPTEESSCPDGSSRGTSTASPSVHLHHHLPALAGMSLRPPPPVVGGGAGAGAGLGAGLLMAHTPAQYSPVYLLPTAAPDALLQPGAMTNHAGGAVHDGPAHAAAAPAAAGAQQQGMVASGGGDSHLSSCLPAPASFAAAGQVSEGSPRGAAAAG